MTSLGHLNVQVRDAANFSIDAKTGKLTSTTAIAAATYSFDVVYTNRAGTAHTEEITMIASAASEATLADIKVESTANATHAIETLDKALKKFPLPRRSLVRSRTGLRIILTTYQRVQC